tara:strand:- start:1012 stop:1893 length:882 start_codon:yes stop_codon:yes gene_type:complete
MNKIEKQTYFEKNKGPLFAVLSSLGYGLNNPLAAVAAQNGISTTLSVISRASFMLVISLIFALAGKLNFKIPNEVRPYLVTMAITTAFINLCYVGSINFISVSLAAIIFFTFPIQILLVTIIRGGQNIRISDIIIFAVVFVGLIFVIVPDFNNIDPLGVLLAGLSSMSATALYFTAGVAAKKCNPIILSFWVHLFILPLLVLSFLILSPALVLNNLSIYLPVLIMSLCYIGAYYFQMLSLKFTSVLISGLFFNTEPLLTAVAAALILDERLLFSQYIGGILIFVSLIIVSIRK